MRTLIKACSLLGLVALVACTAIVSSDEAVQCSTDGDCTKRGPDFVDSVCSAGLCVAKTASQQGDAGGEGGAFPDAECTKNADCAARGPGFVCSSNMGRCAPTESADCKVIYGEPTAEGTVLYGILSESSQEDTNYFRQIQYSLAAKVAFQEFFDTAGASFKGRKAALIACSEYYPRRAAAHLANAGVKAVLGPGSENRQRPVVETLLPAQIPSFTPWINGNPASVIPGSAELSWLAGFERSEVLPPLNALVAEKEAALRAGGKTKVRIAAVVNEPSGLLPTTVNGLRAYGELLDQRLSLNGKTAIENSADPSCEQNACFKRFVSNQAEESVYLDRAKAILDFKPDIIIPFTDIEWAPQLLPALENELTARAVPAAERPQYLHPFLQIEDSGYKSLPVQADAALRGRIGGIRAVRDNSFELFTQKFKAALTTEAGPGTDPNPGAGRAFETSLLVLLATYAAFESAPEGTEPTPPQIVAALPKVTDVAGPRVTLTDLVTGLSTLNQDKPINFDGLFSFFDLDYTQHTAPATWTTWCVTSLAQYESQPRVFKDGAFDGTPTVCP